MYYADVYCCIWRARLDGSEPKKIVPIVTSKIQDITIDYENSLLYWIEQGNIYRSDLSGNNITQFTVLNSFSPTSISISNGTLFWTQKDVNGNGSIYSYSLISNITTAVLQMTSLDPGDISSLIPKSIMHSGIGGWVGVCVCVCVLDVCVRIVLPHLMQLVLYSYHIPI